MNEKIIEKCDIKDLGKIDVTRFTKTAVMMTSLASRVRIAIVNAILEYDELCTCELEAATGLSQPTITAHLHKLQNAGILNRRENWKYAYYSINEVYRDFVANVLGLQFPQFNK